ncbi:uncharacterized protein LOC113342769 [Papaver somniferum]|uniref:uncharacterized protein LOC113342769 n=1 Tax=Papaver somniferum TaxID=3469 RepID=UPI000E6FAAED|nr:uncharacterized protein LOC113342769 [Papaver somniferum]
MDKSWMGKDGLSPEYAEGVEAFLKYATDHVSEAGIDDEDTPVSILCPCRWCMNGGKPIKVHEVRIHLYVKGINQKYTTWAPHGEETPIDDNTRSHASHNADVQYEFGDYEDNEDLPDDAAAVVALVQAIHDEFIGHPENFQKLKQDAKKPLYPSCKSHTKMSALLKLFNMKSKGAWSDKSFTELLKELKNMLPPDNEFPMYLYEAKKTLMALVVEYEKIHACPNDCLLYRKKYKDDNFCMTCGVSRWKEKKEPSDTSKGVPEKVMWYFPPIPRFRRMSGNPEIAKDLTWHNLKRVADGKLRHHVDSPAWKQVDSKWPEFAREPRNLRLGLSNDGFNPNNNSVGGNYSCWHVMLVTYNLPPSLCMKRKFIMLTMLISGLKHPGNDIHVYLAPLIEDLKKLWKKGAEAYDSYKKEKFNFRAILLWTISDFPAYGNLRGFPKGGYNACPICADRSSSIRIKYSQKNVYTSHRKFLPRKHKFRMGTEAFNGQQELDPAQKPYSGEEVFSQVEAIENLWGKKVKSIVGTLLNIPKKIKDGCNARKDLEDLGMRPELEPKENGKKAYLPPACFRLTAQEKKTFCKTLSELKVLTGYCSNLKNRVSMSDLKLYSLKSHNYHTLMQEFLPLAIRSIFPKHVRYAIIRLCFFFKEICTKEVDVDHLTEVQNDLVVTLCLLEKYFLPSFFDIMVHLTVHLIREVRLCGPVCFRWMYLLERFMKVLKGYIRNRNRVEGCISEGYIMEEAMEICSEQLNIVTIGVPTDKSAQKHKNEESTSLISEGKPLSTPKQHKVSETLLKQAHLTVLNNSTDVQPYIELHMSHLRDESSDKSKEWLLKEHIKTFSDWLEKKLSTVLVEEELQNPNNDISQDLEWIACGPSHYYSKLKDMKSVVIVITPRTGILKDLIKIAG